MRSVTFTGAGLDDLDKVKETLTHVGLRGVEVRPGADAQSVTVQVPAKLVMDGSRISEVVKAYLVQADATATVRRVEFVGSQVGKELVENGLIAIALVALGIVLYLAFRFEWKFGVAAIIANLHDVVIILGFFALFQWEFSLPVLAAVLAVLGYSVNESVVVFDRVRENFRKMRKASVPEVINNAITSTISRTIITHGCTQLMVTSILFFGGDTLFYFALALTIGILFGIYSSVLVASPLVMYLGIKREDMIKPERKREEAVV
jgi:preprotein translocase subunit SecF